MYPKIALIGRTNVGKSKLFNLLIEENKSNVSNISGTTRDLVYGECTWRGAIFHFIDTGGIKTDDQKNKKDQILELTIKQTQKGIKQADLVLIIIDAKIGVTAQDIQVAKILKKSQKPYFFVVNKADSAKIRQKENEFKKIGLSNPHFVSAVTGSGTGDLLDEIYNFLKTKKLITSKEEKTKNTIKVSIIGKPNVGKSSLFNSLAKTQRAIVSEIPHTTQDIIDVSIEYQNKNFLFLDTPGIRKKASKQKNLEQKLSERSMYAARKADMILLVTDMTDLTKQDKNLAGEAARFNSGMIIIANKYDLIKDKNVHTIKEIEKIYYNFFPFLSWVPVICVSAKKNINTQKIFDLVGQIYENKFFEATQKQLDDLLITIIKKRRPPRQKSGKSTFIYKILQTSTNPLRFKLIANYKTLEPNYFKYLERMIRQYFKLSGVSVIIDLEQKKENPNKKNL